MGPGDVTPLATDPQPLMAWKSRVSDFGTRWETAMPGSKIHHFLGTHESALEIIRDIPSLSSGTNATTGADSRQIPLLVQTELVDKGKRLNKTTAGEHVKDLTQRMVVLQKKLWDRSVRQMEQLGSNPADSARLAHMGAELRTIAEQLDKGKFDLALLFEVSWRNVADGILDAAHFLYHLIINKVSRFLFFRFC